MMTTDLLLESGAKHPAPMCTSLRLFKLTDVASKLPKLNPKPLKAL